MGTNPEPNCPSVLFWPRWGANSACAELYFSLQCHHPCSPTAHAPDLPLFLQHWKFCSTPALGRGWSWWTHSISSKALRKSTSRKKDIPSPSRHILLAYSPLHIAEVGPYPAGVGLSAQQGQGARAAEDPAQPRNPEEPAASALSERSM